MPSTAIQSHEALLEENARLRAEVERQAGELRRAQARLEAETRRGDAARDALAQSRKLETLGHLTSGLAHDFANTLAAVSGGFAVILRRTQDEGVLEIARSGEKAAARGRDLVRRLMRFARAEPSVATPIDLERLFVEAEPLVRAALGVAAIEVGFTCAPGVGRPLADPQALEAALLNLCLNARDAMPDGGVLAISAADHAPEADGHPAEMHDRAAVVITVRDNGPGMTPEVLRRVSEPFFTTKPPGQGTGLGLSTARAFAAEAGGALRIESRPGEGAAVSLFLPVAPPRNVLSAPGARGAAGEPGPRAEREALERLAARLRSPPARALLAHWRASRTALGPPDFAAFDPAACGAADWLFVVEADVARAPTGFRLSFVGDALAARLARPLLGRDLPVVGDDGPARWEAAYRRCAHGGRPVYEYARLAFDDGPPETFERLVTPWSTDGRTIDRLTGVAVFGMGGNDRRTTDSKGSA